MSTLDSFNQIVEKLVLEKTLSLEALPQVEKLKALVASQTQTIDNLKAENKGIRDESELRLERLQSLVEENRTLKGREDAVAARERAVHQHEMKAAVADARATAYRESLSIVFAPNTVRNSVQSTVNGNRNSNNGSTYENTYNAVSESRSATEGYEQPNADGSSNGKNAL